MICFRLFLCALKPIELRRWHTMWNIIADSGSIETNEKNAGKCRDSTKRKFFWKCCFASDSCNDLYFFLYVDVSFK